MSTLIAAIGNFVTKHLTICCVYKTFVGLQRPETVESYCRIPSKSKHNSYLLLDLWLQMFAVQAYQISLEKDLCTNQIKPTMDSIIIK